jgi:muramidase (phage lysozyme)
MNQLSAFRYVISECEGTPGEEGYRALFGWRPGNGKVFTSFADHPRQLFSYTQTDGTVIRTSAAGKYQATMTTWDDFIRERGPHDFSPLSQDAFADWLIDKCDATADVLAGRLRAAIDKCGGRWASLPSSQYPQPRRTYEFCVDAFQRAGGVLADERGPIAQPSLPAGITPTQPEENRMAALDTIAGVAAIFNPVVGGLLGALSPLLQAKVAKEINRHTDNPADGVEAAQKLSTLLLSGAKALTGQTDDFKAAAAIVSDPAQADNKAKLEAALDAELDRIAKAGDKMTTWDQALWDAQNKGRQTVSTIAIEEKKAGLWDMTQTLVYIGGATASLIVLAIAGAIVYQALSPDGEISVGLVGLGGPLLMAAIQLWKDVFAYRFDGTKESTAQSQAMAAAIAGNNNRRSS